MTKGFSFGADYDHPRLISQSRSPLFRVRSSSPSPESLSSLITIPEQVTLALIKFRKKVSTFCRLKTSYQWDHQTQRLLFCFAEFKMGSREEITVKVKILENNYETYYNLLLLLLFWIIWFINGICRLLKKQQKASMTKMTKMTKMTIVTKMTKMTQLKQKVSMKTVTKMTKMTLMKSQ